MPDMMMQADRELLVAVLLAAAGAIGWLVAMIVVLLEGRGRGIGKSEVAVVGSALVLILALTYLGSVVRRAPKGEAVNAVASDGGGGVGTCASVRQGSSSATVVELLGRPSLETSSEDILGPGSRVLFYEESRCVVYLLGGVVDHVE